MFAVIVTIEAVPGQSGSLIAALEANAHGARQEPGCLKWEWSRHISDENQFAIYEIYKDQSAFEEHKASEHFAEWKAATESIIAKKVSGQYAVLGADVRE